MIRSNTFCIFLCFLFFHLTLTSRAQNNSLEFTDGPGVPTGYGPVNEATIRLQKNLNNGFSNRFEAFDPEVLVTIKLHNQQFTNHSQNTNGNITDQNNPSSVIGWYFGAQEPEPIFSPMDLLSGPENRFFTSTNKVQVGSGIAIDMNKAVLISNGVSVLNGNLFDGRYYMHDIDVEFSMPVNNPVLHFVGLGGAFNVSRKQSRGFSAELELITEGVTLSGLSGSNVFNVTTNRIRNSASSPQNNGIDYAGSGSVLVVGNEITHLSFKVFVKGEVGIEDDFWGEDTEDGWMLGVSLNAEDIVKFTDRKLLGTILDNKLQRVGGASIKLMDLNNKVLEEIVTDQNGQYEIVLERNKTYKMEVGKEGYFANTKTFSTETDNYEIEINLSIEKEPDFYLTSIVKDKKSEERLGGTKVILTNNFTEEVTEFYTNSDGAFQVQIIDAQLSARISYTIRLEKDGYLSKQLIYNKQLDHEGSYNMHEELDFTLDAIQVGMDIAEIIDIKPIYFDLNKVEIRPDAAMELDKIVQVMNENAAMEIELGSHTDCRGSAAYNLELSDKRAIASAQYIKERITNPERISGKGYGESVPVNDCNCEEGTCDESMHEKNRRTEFKVIKVK